MQQSVGGQEIRSQLFIEPIWEWTLSYEVLRAAAALAEYQTLVGFYNARNGSYDSFLYDDPSDDSIPDVSPYMQFGTGDGATVAFQLSRTLGGSTEAVKNTHSTPKIYVNNVLKTVSTDYTINGAGLVTFTSAPAAAAVIAWSGTYYWRVRFKEDSVEFVEFVNNFWNAKSVAFVSVK